LMPREFLNGSCYFGNKDKPCAELERILLVNLIEFKESVTRGHLFRSRKKFFAAWAMQTRQHHALLKFLLKFADGMNNMVPPDKLCQLLTSWYLLARIAKLEDFVSRGVINRDKQRQLVTAWHSETVKEQVRMLRERRATLDKKAPFVIGEQVEMINYDANGQCVRAYEGIVKSISPLLCSGSARWVPRNGVLPFSCGCPPHVQCRTKGKCCRTPKEYDEVRKLTIGDQRDCIAAIWNPEGLYLSPRRRKWLAKNNKPIPAWAA